MATLNAAECWHLSDRGAIAPGLRADIVLLDDLKDFRVRKVWLAGKLCAVDGDYLPEVHRHDISAVKGSLHLKDFSVERLRLPLKSDYAHVIQIIPGGVVSKNRIARVSRDENGNFRRDPSADSVKVAIVERHQYTGNVAVALLGGYGIRRGAVALSVAHDSHNIIVVGVSDEEMACAVEALVEQEGGIVLVRDGRVIERMPMPVAGLMSDQSGQWVDERLTAIHKAAFQELGIAGEVEPIMTRCFMSLPVIPELKLTDMGLFDVMNFSFTPVEAERPEEK